MDLPKETPKIKSDGGKRYITYLLSQWQFGAKRDWQENNFPDTGDGRKRVLHLNALEVGLHLRKTGS